MKISSIPLFSIFIWRAADSHNFLIFVSEVVFFSILLADLKSISKFILQNSFYRCCTNFFHPLCTSYVIFNLFNCDHWAYILLQVLKNKLFIFNTYILLFVKLIFLIKLLRLQTSLLKSFISLLTFTEVTL